MVLLRFVPVVLIVSLLTGCQKDESTPTEPVLVGTWEWQSSFCGWGGASSPATTGSARQLVLEANGQARLLENGVVRYSTPYTLSRHSSLLRQQEAAFIRFVSQNTEYMYEVNNRSLTLMHDVYDGCSETYTQNGQ